MKKTINTREKKKKKKSAQGDVSQLKCNNLLISHKLWGKPLLHPSQSTGMSDSLHGYFLLSLPGVMFALELSLQATAYSTFPVKYSSRSVCVQIMRVQ